MTDKENHSDESLAEFSDDALIQELERRRRARRDRAIKLNQTLADSLRKLFAENPEVAEVVGVNLAGEFISALNNPEDYQFKITATYSPVGETKT